MSITTIILVTLFLLSLFSLFSIAWVNLFGDELKDKMRGFFKRRKVKKSADEKGDTNIEVNLTSFTSGGIFPWKWFFLALIVVLLLWWMYILGVVTYDFKTDKPGFHPEKLGISLSIGGDTENDIDEDCSDGSCVFIAPTDEWSDAIYVPAYHYYTWESKPDDSDSDIVLHVMWDGEVLPEVQHYKVPGAKKGPGYLKFKADEPNVKVWLTIEPVRPAKW